MKYELKKVTRHGYVPVADAEELAPLIRILSQRGDLIAFDRDPTAARNGVPFEAYDVMNHEFGELTQYAIEENRNV